MAGGHLNAMFGRILDNGVEKEIRGALNFVGFAVEAYNDPSTGNPAGWTIRATSQGIIGTPTYVKELPKWDGVNWVPADDGLVAARTISPVPGDNSGQAAFADDGGDGSFAGITLQDELSDLGDPRRAVMRGAQPDAAEQSGEAQLNALDASGAELSGIRVAYQAGGGEAPAGLLHAFFGGPLVYKPAVTGSSVTLQQKQNALLDALENLTLISDATTHDRNDFVVAAADTDETVGGDNLGAPDVGTLVSVATTTGKRGFRGYQISNSGSDRAVLTLLKARGTTASPSVPSTNGDGIGAFEMKAWDGSAWADAGYLDGEVRTVFGTISGSLPAVRLKLNSFGPSYAKNELSSGPLLVPLSDTYHDVSHNLTNSTPTVVLTTQTIANDTVTHFRVRIVAKDQTTNDWYFRHVSVLVKKIGTNAAVVQALTGGVDETFATDGSWVTAFSINGSNQLVITITSDATNNVHWSTYVWEMTIPNA